MRAVRQGLPKPKAVKYHKLGERAGRHRTRRMFWIFVRAIWRSREPSGNVGKAVAKFLSNDSNSIRVRRFRPYDVSICIVSSFVFDRAHRGLLEVASAPKEAVASLATGTQRRSASKEHLQP